MWWSALRRDWSGQRKVVRALGRMDRRMELLPLRVRLQPGTLLASSSIKCARRCTDLASGFQKARHLRHLR